MSELLICGAGDLGLRVAERLRRVYGPAVCATRTSANHARISELGFEPRLSVPELSRFSRLLICFPPSRDYVDEVGAALSNWNGEGSALLVSSVGVYTQSDGAWVDEASAVDETSPIAVAESLAVAKGAHVLRLAGLYDLKRGPQVFWEKQGRVDAWGNGIVNLLHRDDAAEACARILERSPEPGRLWCLSDGSPLTRSQIAEAWSRVSGQAPSLFTRSEGPLGKRVASVRIRDALAWHPRWPSFLDFAAAQKP